MSARDELVTYAATTRTVTADGLAPFLDAYRAEVLNGAAAVAASCGGCPCNTAEQIAGELRRKAVEGGGDDA